MSESYAHSAASSFQSKQLIAQKEPDNKDISKSKQYTKTAGTSDCSISQTSRVNANPKLPPSSSPFSTTFHLAYPPPHGSLHFSPMKPRLLVQLLQQAVRKKRLQPVFEILLTPPLRRRYWQKDVHCRSGDIALVCGDFYSDCTLLDGSRVECSEDEEDEEESDRNSKVIAVIRSQRKIHPRQFYDGQITNEGSGPVRFFFSCGAVWEAITAQVGNHYQLVVLDPGKNKANGDYKLLSWTRDCRLHENRGTETQTDVKFCLRVVDGNFQDMSLVATATRQAIEITYQHQEHDGLQSPFSSQASFLHQSAGRQRPEPPSKRDNPFRAFTSFSEPLYLSCLVLTSAIWVASSEGWLSHELQT